MCNKVILENGETLKSVPDCYKNQEMCNKAVDNYPHAWEFVPKCYKTQKCVIKVSILSTIEFVPEWLMTQEMCDKAINTYYFVFDAVHNQYKTQEMCDRVVYDDPFLNVYCPDKYITQKMFDKAVDYFIYTTLKIVPHWFVTSKMIKNFLLLCMQMKIYSLYSGDIIFNCNELGILNIDLSNINLDNNFDEDYLTLLFLSDFWLCLLNLKN